MTKFEQIKISIINRLSGLEYNTGDFSDIGNEIGIALGEYTMEGTADDDGSCIDILIDGIKHGVSIIDGSH